MPHLVWGSCSSWSESSGCWVQSALHAVGQADRNADESETVKQPGVSAIATELFSGAAPGRNRLSADEQEEASLFFQLLNRRHEKASITLTSNKGGAD